MANKKNRYLGALPVVILIIGYSIRSYEPNQSDYSFKLGQEVYGEWLKFDGAYFNYNSGYDVAVYNGESNVEMALVKLDKSCIKLSNKSYETTVSFNGLAINFMQSCIERHTASLFPLNSKESDKLLDVFTYKYGVLLTTDIGEQAFFKTDGISDVISFLNTKYINNN